MLLEIGYFCGGIITGYLFYEMNIRKKKGILAMIRAVKNKRPIVFLETNNAIFMKTVIKTFHNLGITEDKEIIIMPPSSIKACSNLGGIQIGHGDLYRSILVPHDVSKFSEELKTKHGFNTDEIGDFFDTAMNISRVELKKQLEESELKDKLNADSVSKIQKTYDIYQLMPSTVQDFIFTGLNRVSIYDMLKNLVDQRELEKLGNKNWIAIGAMILLVLIGLGLLIQFAGPSLLPYFQQIQPQQQLIPPAKIG